MKGLLPWEREQARGVRTWFRTFAEVLRHPSRVFALLGEGPLGPAYAYLGIFAAGFALLATVGSATPRDLPSLWGAIEGFVVAIPRFLLGAAVGGAGFHGLALLRGGRAHYSVALRTAAYASTCWVAALPILLMGNGPGSTVLLPVTIAAVFWYGLRAATAVLTRQYGLPERSAWVVWAQTVALWCVVMWLIA